MPTDDDDLEPLRGAYDWDEAFAQNQDEPEYEVTEEQRTKNHALPGTIWDRLRPRTSPSNDLLLLPKIAYKAGTFAATAAAASVVVVGLSGASTLTYQRTPAQPGTQAVGTHTTRPIAALATPTASVETLPRLHAPKVTRHGAATRARPAARPSSSASSKSPAPTTSPAPVGSSAPTSSSAPTGPPAAATGTPAPTDPATPPPATGNQGNPPAPPGNGNSPTPPGNGKHRKTSTTTSSTTPTPPPPYSGGRHRRHDVHRFGFRLGDQLGQALAQCEAL